MPSWLSAEDLVSRVVMTRIYNSPIMQEVGEQVFDEIPTDVKGATYIVLGESEVSEKEYSQAMHETIAITLHVYHINDASPEKASIYTRDLVKRLKFILLKPFETEHYVADKPRLDMSQVITDIDSRSRHGVIRMKFKVRHKLKY